MSLTATATLDVEAKASDGTPKRPTFTIHGYTGAPMILAGFYSPVIVDLAGLKSSSQTLPILRSHDADRIVGQSDIVKIDATGVTITGTITGDNADSAEVVTQSKNGFRWQASIGASIDRREFIEAGKTAKVNGREVAGPIIVAREATLYETSFVAIGADSQTTANVAASSSPGTPQGINAMNFDQWLAAKGFDPAALSDGQKAALKAAYNVEHPATPPPASPTPPPAQQTPPPDPAVTQSLTDIFASQRAENERISEITRITAQALRDRPGMADVLERMSKTAIEAKVAPRDYELETLRATRATPGAFAIHSHGDVKATAKVIEAAVCKAGGLEDREKVFDANTLQAADDRFRNGIGLCQLIRIAARENRWTGGDVKTDIAGALYSALPPLGIQAQGYSTFSLSTILGNVANKFLGAGFNAVESTWRMISARRSVNDFKQITTAALTGGFTYEKVGPAGELKHATASELTYNNQVETYGRMFAITRKDIINDDLGALTAIPRKLGRGAALGLNRDFWTVFLNNSAFFTSGRANYQSGAGTVLSLSSLDAGQALFLNQTDPDGDPVAITPRILLVPNALKVAASNFMNSTTVVNNTTANTTTLGNNPFAGLYQVESSSYMSNSSYTGYSTTAWYLLASPEDMAVIEVAFLNGKETPTVESADADFNTLGVQFRGFWDYGVATQEYRAGIKSAGA